VSDRVIAESRSISASRAVSLVMETHARYTAADDWVFCLHDVSGTKPYWDKRSCAIHRPVAFRVGVQRDSDGHPFRHTYSTLPPNLRNWFNVMQSCVGIQLCDPV